MSATTTSKYQIVRDGLEAAIRSGELTTGDQLPAEQTIAQQYGVSLMTARRVVCDLVSADFLERRARKGTFVRHHAVERIDTTTLNLIVPAYEGSFQRMFLSRGLRIAEKKGWRGNVIRLSPGQQDPAVRAIQDGEMALIMVDEVRPQSALGLAMRGSKGRVISIGRDMTKIGVPSIFVDPRRSFQIAIEHLRNLGHSQITLIIQDLSAAANEMHRSTWQKCMAELYDYTPEEADERLIHLQTPDFECPSFDAYDAVRKVIEAEAPPTTAFLCFGEEITQGVLAACRATGKQVPESLSVVNILDASSMVFSYPPVTSVDVNFEGQIEIALSLLENARSGNLAALHVHSVEPHLVERDSAGPINWNE